MIDDIHQQHHKQNTLLIGTKVVIYHQQKPCHDAGEQASLLPGCARHRLRKHENSAEQRCGSEYLIVHGGKRGIGCTGEKRSEYRHDPQRDQRLPQPDTAACRQIQHTCQQHQPVQGAHRAGVQPQHHAGHIGRGSAAHTEYVGNGIGQSPRHRPEYLRIGKSGRIGEYQLRKAQRDKQKSACRRIKEIVAGAPKGVFHQQNGKYIGNYDNIIRNRGRQHQGNHHSRYQCREIMGIMAFQPHQAAQPLAQHTHRHGDYLQHDGTPAVVECCNEIQRRHA